MNLISLVAGLLIELVLAPYAGKQSGETALMEQMLDRLQAGDTLVAEYCYCSFWIVAACQNKGVNSKPRHIDKLELINAS